MRGRRRKTRRQLRTASGSSRRQRLEDPAQSETPGDSLQLGSRAWRTQCTPVAFSRLSHCPKRPAPRQNCADPLCRLVPTVQRVHGPAKGCEGQITATDVTAITEFEWEALPYALISLSPLPLPLPHTETRLLTSFFPYHHLP